MKKHIGSKSWRQVWAPILLYFVGCFADQNYPGTPNDRLDFNELTKPERALLPAVIHLDIRRHGDGNVSVIIPRMHLEGVGNPTTNSCSDLDMALYDMGKACGSPLSMPCFDYSRCEPSSESIGPKIYIYDHECSLDPSARLDMAPRVPKKTHLDPVFRNAANEMGLLAKDYESACLFVHVNNGRGPQPCASSTPLWNNGANHMMIDFTDNTRDTRKKVVHSYAMEAASSIKSCYYRSGYDIVLPLAPKMTFPEVFDVPAGKRRFFLTFKGSLYLTGHGSEERFALAPLHDEANGVVISQHCFELHQEHLIKGNVEYCQALKDSYDAYGYREVMNTTFGLVPAGRSPGTFRLGEVMSAGAIPVFVARNVVRPFPEQFDWSAFSFIFSPDEVGKSMIRTLRAVSPERLATMQRKSLEAYEEIFGEIAYDNIARRVFSLVRKRIEHSRL